MGGNFLTMTAVESDRVDQYFSPSALFADRQFPCRHHGARPAAGRRRDAHPVVAGDGHAGEQVRPPFNTSRVVVCAPGGAAHVSIMLWSRPSPCWYMRERAASQLSPRSCLPHKADRAVIDARNAALRRCLLQRFVPSACAVT